MSDIDDLKSLLGDPSNIASLAETLGASEDDTRQAVAAAVPALLGGLAMQADDPERYYREVLLPQKVAMYAEYVRTRSLLGDLRVLIATAWAVVARG